MGKHLLQVKGPGQQSSEAGLHKSQAVGRRGQVERGGEPVPLIPQADVGHIAARRQQGILQVHPPHHLGTSLTCSPDTPGKQQLFAQATPPPSERSNQTSITEDMHGE